jgi:hypothetical protein
MKPEYEKAAATLRAEKVSEVTLRFSELSVFFPVKSVTNQSCFLVQIALTFIFKIDTSVIH